jgi:hypothetical protein
MKVVHHDEGHNFHVDWHFKFWVEIGEKLDRLTIPPVHRDKPASMLARRSFKIR